jgi:predicted N-acetyltransferase YhbS
MTSELDGLTWRRLQREEIGRVFEIDRREIIHRVFDLRDGALVARAAFFDMAGWSPSEREHTLPWLEASFDRGARFVAVFDRDQIVGVAVVDTVLLGPERDLVQLSFLHVGRDCRDRGLGTALFDEATRIARELGARGLYVSATPSEHTVRFYQARGCRVTAEPDPELFSREPEDIHFECRFSPASDPGATRTTQRP